MNKIVRNGALLVIGGLSLTSCGKQDLIDQNEKLTNQVNFYKNQTKLLWEKINEAQAQIDANLVTIDALDVQVGDLTAQVEDLETENGRLNQLIVSLQADIDVLEQTIVDYENEVIEINNLLAIEQQKDVVNQEVIETLEAELAAKQDAYDELVANPIVITEIRTEIITQIVELSPIVTNDGNNVTQERFNELLERIADLNMQVDANNELNAEFLDRLAFMNTSVMFLGDSINEQITSLEGNPAQQPLITAKSFIDAIVIIMNEGIEAFLAQATNG